MALKIDFHLVQQVGRICTAHLIFFADCGEFYQNQKQIVRLCVVSIFFYVHGLQGLVVGEHEIVLVKLMISQDLQVIADDSKLGIQVITKLAQKGFIGILRQLQGVQVVLYEL